MDRPRVDGLTIVALAFLLFFGFNVLRDQGLFSGLFDAPVRRASASGSPAAQPDQIDAAPASGSPEAGELADGVQKLTPLTADSIVAAPQPAELGDPNVIIYPYTSFTLTQGPHGMDYGHMAIDITAGNGASILSPINGIVSAVFIDQYNNTNLIIENDRYSVTLLHGNYTVHVGEQVSVGQLVGAESNNGYTLDAMGQLCAGRDCGYHTHINIYDKTLFSNVNPMDVLKPAPQTAQ